MTNARQENAATNEPADSNDADRGHLADVEDGCGCAELWEHLSERRGTNPD